MTRKETLDEALRCVCGGVGAAASGDGGAAVWVSLSPS